MAFLLFLLFLTTAVFGRILLQYKMTGDHGVRVSKTNSPIIHKVTSILLLIAFAGIFSLSAFSFKGIIQPSIILNYRIQLLGQILAVLGIILTVFSQYQMGQEWRIGVRESEKTRLVTEGIFRYSRNPIYVAIMVFCLGLVIILPHWLNLIFSLMTYIGIIIHVIYVEEPHLQKLHGDEFATYKIRTARFLPLSVFFRS